MTGHVLIDSSGNLASLDEGFCTIMRASAESLLGRSVREITAPADREECDIALDRLGQQGTPFVITKRFIRDDGSLVWVRNTVSISVPLAGPSLVIATIEPIRIAAEDRSPARLLDCARQLVSRRRNRTAIVGEGLLSDPAWDITLLAYVAEAIGRTIDVETIADDLSLSRRLAGSWVTALLHHGVLELELAHDAHARKSYRLTGPVQERLEQYLRSAQDGQWVRAAA